MNNETASTPLSPTPTCVDSFSRSSTAPAETWHTMKVPFEKCHEVYKDLEHVREVEKPAYLRAKGSKQRLPDAPRVRLDCPSDVVSYCLKDLSTPELDKLGKKLWWAEPNPDIVSLSQHTVVDRRIQVTEDPSVHMLWVEGILYVKPLPVYLTSHAFWQYLTDETNSDISSEARSQLVATSLGFLKTYGSLIQHRSDFNLARRHDLLGGFEDTSFESFVAFIASFDSVPSRAISSRWRYGLIQLDALNFHSAIHLRRLHLNRFESRYSTYFSRFFPVLLFIFALLSVILSAMQVIIGAKQMWDTENEGLKKTLGIFVWAGTEAIGWTMGFGVFFVVWWIAISTSEAWNRAVARKKVQKRLQKEDVCP